MSYTPYGLEVYLSAYNYYPTDRPDYLPNADYHMGKAFFYFTSLDGVVEYMNILGDPSLIIPVSVTSTYNTSTTTLTTSSTSIPEFSTWAVLLLVIVPVLILKRKEPGS